jgi:acyl-CoA-dependent ceramide synthase
MDTLRPFFFLSHPTTPPVHLDSFPDADYYKNGPNDILFVIGGAIIFAFLREATMKVSSAFMVRWFRLARDKNGHIITPPKLVPPVNGGHMNGNGDGLRPRKNSTDLDVKVDTEAERTLRRAQRKELKVLEKNVTRFGEQAWSVLYYTVFFSLGMVSFQSRRREDLGLTLSGAISISTDLSPITPSISPNYGKATHTWHSPA